MPTDPAAAAAAAAIGDIDDEKFKAQVAAICKKFETRSGAFNGERVGWFTARKVMKFLGSAKGKGLPKLTSEEEIVAFCNRMAFDGFIMRTQLAPHTEKMLQEGIRDARIDLLEHRKVKSFDVEDKASYYVFTPQCFENLQGSKKFMSMGLILGSAAICMIKIWPLWLKVLVYWTSLSLLITLTTLISVRWVIYVPMWMVGLKKWWLFPNLMNDDLDLLDAFKPVWGRPIDEIANEEPDKKEGGFDFGLVNLLAIIGLGGAGCWYVGMFDASNVPDFVADRNDLFHQFPSLAPPDYDPNAEK